MRGREAAGEGKMTTKEKGRIICKCECGGNVRGVEQFGRLWTWCEKCTPVVKCSAGR